MYIQSYKMFLLKDAIFEAYDGLKALRLFIFMQTL